MRFREVERNIEEEKLNKKEERFKKIKPETDITIDEARAFIYSIFASEREFVKTLFFLFLANITYSFMKRMML